MGNILQGRGLNILHGGGINILHGGRSKYIVRRGV